MTTSRSRRALSLESFSRSISRARPIHSRMDFTAIQRNSSHRFPAGPYGNTADPATLSWIRFQGQEPRSSKPSQRDAAVLASILTRSPVSSAPPRWRTTTQPGCARSLAVFSSVLSSRRGHPWFQWRVSRTLVIGSAKTLGRSFKRSRRRSKPLRCLVSSEIFSWSSSVQLYEP
ncbi:hypothetical protein D3C85_824940 [compost metagenome]